LKHTRITAALAAAAVVAAIGLAAPANAATPPSATSSEVHVDPASVASARMFLDRYEVQPATAERLIRRYEDGGTWLAASSTNSPVSSRTQDDGDALATIRTYADGSINVERLEKPAPLGDSRGISGCSHSGTSYSNCKVDFWWGVVSMSFRANYSLKSGDNRITNVYAASWSIGGACGTSKNYFGRPTAKIARLEVQAQMCVIPHSQTFWLQLALSGNKAAFTFG
jgi:hypothetical protein